MGRPRFISLLSFCRDSLGGKFFWDEFAGLVLKSAPLEDLGFSVGVVSLSWFVPIIALGTRVSSLHGLAAFRCFQGSWRGHACFGLGRNKWHFPGFYWHTSSSQMCTSGATYCPFDPPSRIGTLNCLLIWTCGNMIFFPMARGNSCKLRCYWYFQF